MLVPLPLPRSVQAAEAVFPLALASDSTDMCLVKICCYHHLTLSSKQYGEACFVGMWRGTHDGSIIEGKRTMKGRERKKTYECGEEEDGFPCPTFAPPPSQCMGLPVTLFQPIIWEDSHYLSKWCKQIPGWRPWASWGHYNPGWTQSWSLHGQHTGHSPSSWGGPQNHPAEKKSRVLKFQIFWPLGLYFCL